MRYASDTEADLGSLGGPGVLTLAQTLSTDY